MNKRPNPFDRKPLEKEFTASNTENARQIDVVEEEQTNLTQNYQQQPVQQPQMQQPQTNYYQNYQQSAYQQSYSNHPVRNAQPRRPIENNKVKYTATMDQALRTEIKIACATKGIMFSQFIEDACREKLSREGVRK